MMRRSIETGLCKPWQPLTRMDFVVLEMDNTIGLEVLFATAIFSHKVKSSTTFHTLEPIPFVNEFVSNAGQPSEPIIRQLSLLNPSNLSVPSIPTSPIHPFHFSAKHHTVTYKTFLLFEFPCSQHVTTQRTFQFQI